MSTEWLDRRWSHGRGASEAALENERWRATPAALAPYTDPQLVSGDAGRDRGSIW